MTDYTAKADSLLTFMQSRRNTPSTGETFSAGWEAAKEDSKPLVIPDARELWEAYEDASTNSYGMAVVDASGRLWIIGDDEDGYQWATSFAFEDDTVTLPAQFDVAPLAWPLTILPIPSPVPQTGEPNE
jgi:hypothetical protein